MPRFRVLICGVICGVIWLECVVITHAQATSPSVDLLWEAQTSSHPFYLGHSQPSPQSVVRVVALPAGDDIDFQWTKDGRRVGSASGLGKNVLLYTAEATGANTVSVIATNKEGVGTERAITITPQAPRVVIYPNDPLAGPLYAQAVGDTFNLATNELTLVATPFYFSLPATGQNLDYAWQINGKAVTPANTPANLTVAAPDGGSGENTVALTVTNPNQTLQTAVKQFIIKFGVTNFNF